MANWLKKNWKICGIGFSVVAAVLLGFILPDRTQIAKWFHATGFYFIFGTFLIWLLALLPKNIDINHIKNFFRRHGIALGLSAVLTVCAFRVCPPNFRILADETNLVGMSMAMYDQQSVHNPYQGLYYYDSFHEVAKTWDKRPIFYSFLIYLVHTLFGYSGYNGFAVNAVAGFLTIFCFYILLRRWFPKIYALGGMILLASFPVLIIWITSSGFEIVNLLFIIIAFIFLDLFIEKREIYYAEMLGLTLILLGQCRYESPLFTIAILPVVLVFMRRELFAKLTFRSFLIPLLYLPIAWNSLIPHNHEIGNNQAAFSIDYFFRHLRQAWQFFSGQLEQYGMIPLLFFLAVAGLLIVVVRIIRHRRDFTPRAVGLSVACALSFALECIIIFNFYWGDLTKQFSMRFGIVFLPVIVWLVVYFLYIAFRDNTRWKRYIMIGCFGLLLFYWPAAGKNQAVKEIFLHRSYLQALNFLESQYPDRNILVISDRPGMYTVHRWGAVNFGYADQNASILLQQLSNHLFQEIIVIQKIAYKNQLPVEETRINPIYRLQPLYETQVSGSNYIRFSRVQLHK